MLIKSDAQAMATLEAMRRGVRRAMNDHDFVIWAREEIRRLGTDTRDAEAVAQAVRSFIERAIQFAPDPKGIENLTPPQTHMRLLMQQPTVLGDCDDAATLAAAMAGSLGVPSSIQMRAFWSPSSPYQHVVTFLKPRGRPPLNVDTTRNAQKLPPTATRAISINV